MKICLIGLAVIFMSCGKYNFNKIFVPKGQEEALDVLISKARFAYDHGDFNEALTYAEKAQKINNQDEEVAIIKGYIHLGLAGMDPFTIAKKLIATQSTSTSSSSSSSSSSTSGFLTTMSSIVGIDETVVEKLSSEINESTVSVFTGYPVPYPLQAEDAREESLGVDIIYQVNQAIEAVCPIVSDDALIEQDSRHGCDRIDVERKGRAKAHFLWGFAHLTEALAFNSVLMYSKRDSDTSGTEGAKSNLQKRFEGAQNISKTEILSLVSAFGQLASDIDAVFPVTVSTTSEKVSMFQGLLNDMTAASKGFSLIGGSTKSLTSGLDSAMSNINSVKDSASQTQGEAAGYQSSSNELKSQLTKKFSEIMSTKISELPADTDPAKVAEACASFKTVSSGIEDTSLIPEQCK